MIEIMYSCHKCGIKQAKVFVVARPPREDVVDFVNRAALQCKADHDGKSPDCETDRLDELFIPVPGDDAGIGDEPPKQ